MSSHSVETVLLFAKSRVSPLKGLTIPRAELLVCLIGVRAIKFVQKQLKLENAPVLGWSDSRCVQLWLHSVNFENYPRSVRNRVKEIRESKIAFRHVPSESNPADLGTRGISPTELKTSEIWWCG